MARLGVRQLGIHSVALFSGCIVNKELTKVCILGMIYHRPLCPCKRQVIQVRERVARGMACAETLK